MWHILVFSSTYVGYANGARHNTPSVAFATWIIFSLTYELLSSRNIYIGLAINNIVEYSMVIELMSEASTFRIHQLVLRMDSYLMASHMNLVYSICNPILFC